MVNLESQNLMHLSDFSVLHEIFLPNSTTSIDPKLVLHSRPYLPNISQVSPQRKDPPVISSPAPVPLSVQELERVDSKEELGLGDDSEGAPRVNAGSPQEAKSPAVDIVNLAAEEIRKPLIKVKDDAKGRVAWNLAGLVGHLPDTAGLPHPYPGYPAPHPHTGYSPHLLPQGLPTDLPHSYSNFGAAMGVSQPSLVTSMATHTTATPSAGSGNSSSVPANPTYKMEPTDPGMYYPGTSGVGEGDHQTPGIYQPSHHIPGVSGSELGPTGLIEQTLHAYFGQHGGDMPPQEDGSNWLGEAGAGLHPGLFSPQDYEYGRGYTDRKKKIIREWNKTNSSPRPPETLTSDPLRQSYLPGHELFQHPSTLTYNPYGVKDEPLRSEYPYAYGYPELVNPYHHAMTRREKRKKQDSLPGGNTLTRDERKAQAMGLPIPCSEIINLPMDEFNDLLSKHELTEEQLTLCRDIRRRGKNKVAAQNCRKRKIDQIKQLETEVTRIKCRKTELVTDHEKLMQQRATWSDLVKRLHDYVLKELGHDPVHWQLQMDHNRQVHILPRNGGPPIAGPGPLPAEGLGQGGLGQQDQHHEQAVNMAAAPKGSRGYDIGGRAHGGQVPHAPSPLHHQSQLHQNSS